MPTGVGVAATWIGANAGAITAVASAASAAGGVYAASQQRKAQRAQLNAVQAAKPLTAADRPQLQEVKPVDLNAIRNKNAQLAAGSLAGQASTLLTGSSGIDSSTLNLGRSTLLGQ
jgi:hypothetical protein